MKDSGIEDILIGESYRSTKKKRKGPIFFIIFLLIIGAICAGYYYYTNLEVVDAKALFSKNLISLNSKKLADSDFYSTILDRVLSENSEMTTNFTISSTEEFESLQGIDVNNFDFELSSQNDLKQKNFYHELYVKYLGNDFINFKSIINDNLFSITSDEIVNKYVGVRAENYNDIFNSKIDLEFLYELTTSGKINMTKDDRDNYLQNYYSKIFEQISNEKFSMKENFVITKNNEYIDVTAYELALSQSELKNILTSLITDIKNDNNLLSQITINESVELDLSDSEENDNTDGLEVRNEEEVVMQLTPVSENNFQTAEVVYPDEEYFEEDNVEEFEELPEEEYFEEENWEEEPLEENVDEPEYVEEEAGRGPLSIETREVVEEKKKFTSNDFIKILLGRKVNLTIDRIAELLDEYLENLEGNGLVVTLYVSSERTEKVSITLPNGNKIDIQFIEDTNKANTIEITYLYQNSDYKTGYSYNFEEVHNSSSTTFKIVKKYIEDEKVNKKISFSIQTEGTKNANSLSNDIVYTISTNSNETKIIAENNIRFVSDNMLLEKLTNENSVFLDDLSLEEQEATLRAIDDKINLVLENKKETMNLIDLNSGSSIVDQNFSSTRINYTLLKNVLQNLINNMRDEAIERGEEFTLQNLNDLYVDGYEITTNVYEDRAIVVIDVYTFNVDMDFIVSET